MHRDQKAKLSALSNQPLSLRHESIEILVGQLPVEIDLDDLRVNDCVNVGGRFHQLEPFTISALPLRP